MGSRETMCFFMYLFGFQVLHHLLGVGFCHRETEAPVRVCSLSKTSEPLITVGEGIKSNQLSPSYFLQKQLSNIWHRGNQKYLTYPGLGFDPDQTKGYLSTERQVSNNIKLYILIYPMITCLSGPASADFSPIECGWEMCFINRSISPNPHDDQGKSE